MKRALALILIIAACVAGYLSIRGTMPFMPIFGSSMEPELKAGDLIMIKQVSPSEIEVGDIVVYSLPAMIREHYNYPPTVAHRVIEVRQTDYGVGFRTKGDNTGEDPFTVRPEDLRGTVNQKIPYLGFPFLFLQSQQGLMFLIIALCLLALYLYTDELGRGRQKVQRGLFSPVIEENQRSSQVIAQRMENTEKTMVTTQQALAKFALAIGEYAEHLRSHTSAIQGLSEASQELKKGAAEQNKVLTRLAEVMEQPRPAREEAVPQPQYKVPPPPLEAMEEAIPTIPVTEEVVSEVSKVSFPPGCFRTRRQLARQGTLTKAS